MARYPALIETLARLDGRPFPTIDNYARALRSSGFLSETQRGNRSTEVTPDDAANLLIGLLATDSPTAAPRAMQAFRGLVRLPAPPAKDLPRTLGLLIQLPTFAEFLSASIDYAEPLRNGLGEFGLELHVTRSVPAAGLIYSDPEGRRRRIAGWVSEAPQRGARASLPNTEVGTDRRLTATITHRTILALGELVHREITEIAA